MSVKYSTILVAGDVQTYNDNPPADDGSKTASNLVKFSTITSDLTAPLHSAITRMDDKLLLHTDEGPDVHTSTYTTIASDFAKLLECSGTFTLSLRNPASAVAGYKTMVKNAGAGTITVNADGAALIDGASSDTLIANEAREYRLNNAETAYLTSTGRLASGSVPKGAVMMFVQAAAPVGWSITATWNNRTPVINTAAGGTTGGAWNAATGVDTGLKSVSHTHTGTASGTTGSGSNHSHSGTNHNHSFSDSDSVVSGNDGAHGHGLVTGTENLGDVNVTDATGSSQVARYQHTHSISQHLGHTHNVAVSISGTTGLGGTGSTGGESSHTHSFSDGFTTSTPTSTSHDHTVGALTYAYVITCTKG